MVERNGEIDDFDRQENISVIMTIYGRIRITRKNVGFCLILYVPHERRSIFQTYDPIEFRWVSRKSAPKSAKMEKKTSEIRIRI